MAFKTAARDAVGPLIGYLNSSTKKIDKMVAMLDDLIDSADALDGKDQAVVVSAEDALPDVDDEDPFDDLRVALLDDSKRWSWDDVISSLKTTRDELKALTAQRDSYTLHVADALSDVP